jgi:flagellar motor protein MotB
MSEEHAQGQGGGESHEAHAGGHAGGHGGAHEEHEGAPEWLISFADNVALLMGFFVILLAMNMATKHTGGIGSDGDAPAKGVAWDEVDFVIGLREAFNSPIDINSTKPSEQVYVRRMLEKQSGQGASQEGPRGSHPSTQSNPVGEYNRITATVSFADRQAVISADDRQVLAQTAQRLKDQRWIIEVRGHASPLETMHNQARGRELAFQRAMAAAAALVESGLKWESLRVVSCGDASRVVPRALTAEDDRQNQRAEVIVTNEVLPPDPYARPAGEPRAPGDGDARPPAGPGPGTH